jgi:hypothetical protein
MQTSADRGCEAWAQQQFGDAALGDPRRTRRLVRVASAMASSAGASIPSAFRQDTAGQEGAYRFANNHAVALEEIVRSGGRGTASRIDGGATLLALCDSSFLEFSHRSARGDMGDAGGPAASRVRGVWSHNVLLVERQDLLPLGLLHQDYWVRDRRQRGKAARRLKTPYQDKESYKWERAIDASCELLTDEQQSRVIFVCDREADVFELLHRVTHGPGRFVIRASWNRALVEHEPPLLLDAVDSLPVVGSRQVQIAQRGGRPARLARLELRSGVMTLRSPHRTRSRYEPLDIGVVVATETEPPEGVEPLHWVLLTSEPVDTDAAANEVVSIYSARWLVEDLHKAWKTGCKVEELRLQSGDALLRVAAILAQVAARQLRLRQLAHVEDAEQPASAVLDKLELRCLMIALSTTPDGKKDVAKLRRRGTPMTAREAYHFIGGLGGWHDTKRTGRVGWEAYWRGWSELARTVQIARAFESDDM